MARNGMAHLQAPIRSSRCCLADRTDCCWVRTENAIAPMQRTKMNERLPQVPRVQSDDTPPSISLHDRPRRSLSHCESPEMARLSSTSDAWECRVMRG